MNGSSEQIVRDLILSYPTLQAASRSLITVCDRITDSLSSGGVLYVCGNGGSAADAEHIAGELLKGFRLPRPLDAARQQALAGLGKDGQYLAQNIQGGLRCISLNGHPSLATAMGNDVNSDLVYAQQLNALGKRGDILLGISTSGNARNICLAALIARQIGILSIALTGDSGGKLAPLCDLAIMAPAHETYRVQEFHVPLYHALCGILEAEFFT